MEVPRNEWPRFFEGYSRSHEGWLCTVDAASFAPLVSVRSQGSTIAISRRGNDVHTIRHAARVYVDTDARGADCGLHIEAAEGGVTIICFRAAASPESLDGFVP